MGSKYPSLKAREVVRALERHGFRLKAQKGSHAKYTKHEDKKRRNVTVPIHNDDIDKGTLKQIIIQSGLTIDEFMGKL